MAVSLPDLTAARDSLFMAIAGGVLTRCLRWKFDPRRTMVI